LPRTSDCRGIPKDQGERIAIAENRSDIEDRVIGLVTIDPVQELSKLRVQGR
jgi:hypothetical protein